MTEFRLDDSFDSDGLQYIWSANSIGLAETCLRKYQLQKILRWRPKSKSFHLKFGTRYAEAVERYHRLRANGMDIEEACVEIVREALINTWDHELDENGERIEGTGAPWDSGDTKKNRENLIRSIIWYVYHYQKDNLEVIKLADGSPAVELEGKLEIDNGLILMWRIDRLVNYSNDPYVMDQKAQPLTSLVLCDDGWKCIGELEIGNKVATKSGEFTKVIKLFPKGVTNVYRVKFNDNTFVDCAEDHLWAVGTQFTNSFNVLELTEMLKILSEKPYTKFHVPITEPVDHTEKQLLLHPYLLGVLLGDGYLNGNSIQLSTTKKWLIDNVRKTLPKGERIRKSSNYNNSWTISGGQVLNAIKQLGLKGKKSRTKFIPCSYLFSSIEQRTELLQGLLDTDGGWNGKSRIYDSCGLELAQAVCSLVRSLGGSARLRNRGDGCFRVSLRLPELPTGIGKRYITSITKRQKDETMCIQVADKSGLYITDNYTVTHNTTAYTLNNRYFLQYNPDTQMSMYTFVGKAFYSTPVKGVIIDAAQIAVGFTEFQRGFSPRTDSELEEWYDDAMYHMESAREATRSGYFPKRTSACNNYGGCQFRHICGMGAAHRDKFLRSDFEQTPYEEVGSR